ncbi:hypothetical protein BaRGS_00029572 [Batillaria attramentaria]|uniref:Secreted protein n=1 Tax=Batillaria attramentaria TaxID=370345 RepID=A0ABD0JWK1_9CAEN
MFFAERIAIWPIEVFLLTHSAAEEGIITASRRLNDDVQGNVVLPCCAATHANATLDSVPSQRILSQSYSHLVQKKT